MQTSESLEISVLAQPNLHKSLRNTKWKKKRQQTGKTHYLNVTWKHFSNANEDNVHFSSHRLHRPSTKKIRISKKCFFSLSSKLHTTQPCHKPAIVVVQSLSQHFFFGGLAIVDMIQPTKWVMPKWECYTTASQVRTTPRSILVPL